MASFRSDRGEPTVVTDGMHISGNLMSEGDVRIDGCVEGDVHSPHVLISEDGSVMGSVFADEVLIRGAVNGHVHARAVTLADSAKVALDITYIEITIEPGAEIEGSLMPVASLDQLLRIPPPRLPPPQSSAVISGSGSAVLDQVWAARPDPAPRPVLDSQMALWPGSAADSTADAGGGPAPQYQREARNIASSAPDVSDFGPELMPGSASALAFELDADTMLEEPYTSEAEPAPAPEPVSFIEPTVAPVADEPPRDRKPNGGIGSALETALGFEIDAEPIQKAEPEAEPVQEFTTTADYIPASTDYPLVDGAAERLPAWKKPPVAVPITLQARDARPRRRYTALAGAALLLLVAGSGLYLGARGIYETEFGVEPAGVAEGTVSGGDQQAEAKGAEIFAPKPQEQARAADTETGTAPGQTEQTLLDPEDARIQAAIEAKRKELEQNLGKRLDQPQGQGDGSAAQDVAQDPADSAEGDQPSVATQPDASAADDAPPKAAAPEDGDLSLQQQTEDYVPPETETEATGAPDAAGQEGSGQTAAVGGEKSKSISPEQAIDDFKAGMAASGRDDFDETIARLSPAIASGKLERENLAAAYRNRARAFAAKGNLDKAIDDYGETIKLLPGDASAYNSRGFIYNKKNLPREAVADISKAIKLMPGYSFAYSNRCWAYRKLGRRDDAIADCRRALALNPRLDFARKSLKRMGAEP